MPAQIEDRPMPNFTISKYKPNMNLSGAGFKVRNPVLSLEDGFRIMTRVSNNELMVRVRDSAARIGDRNPFAVESAVRGIYKMADQIAL